MSNVMWPRIQECVSLKTEAEEDKKVKDAARKKPPRKRKKTMEPAKKDSPSEKGKESNEEEGEQDEEEEQPKEKKPPAERCRKVRLFPSTKQRETLHRWFGTARWTYNMCLQAVKSTQVGLDWKALRDACVNNALFKEAKTQAKTVTRKKRKSKTKKKEVKPRVCTANKTLFEELAEKYSDHARACNPNAGKEPVVGKEDSTKDYKWVMETPFDVRDEAMKDLVKAYDSNHAKQDAQRASGKGAQRFEVRPRSKKKCSTESIVIHSKHSVLSNDGRGIKFHVARFGQAFLRTAEKLPEKLLYDCRLQKDKLNRFYLCVPMPMELREGAGESQARIASLDPGVRKFQTLYDPSGHAMELGVGTKRIEKLCHHVDRLQSEQTKPASEGVDHKRRNKLKRAALRIQERIRNLVNEMHKRISTYLVDNYDVILLPVFETSRMVRKAKRHLQSKSARSMLTWAHHRFQRRLVDKARERPPCKVVICDEDYTSKTCGWCGRVKAKLRGEERFVCGSTSCGYDVDRDLNGARNILLKFLTEDGGMHTRKP